MPKKAPRDRKVTLVKQKKVRAGGKENKHSQLDRMDLADAENAKEYLENRPTKDFSREELGSLMQMAPGGAEPHHIRTRSRQFNRQMSNAKPVGPLNEGRTGGSQKDEDGGRMVRPKSGGPYVSRNNYKIDPED